MDFNVRKICQLDRSSLFEALNSRDKGLTEDSVGAKVLKFGKNEIVANTKKALALEFLSKFANPLVITLFIVSIISFFLGEKLNAVIVIAMAFLSSVVSFSQEHRANKNAEKLAEMVKISVTVIRDGKEKEIPLKNLVPGDIVDLSAGDMVPADLMLIESKDLFVNQSTLNGESFPVRKSEAIDSNYIHKAIFDINNLLFMGSSIVSGSGKAIAINTGRATQFGQVSHEVTETNIETAFDKGIKGYTWLMVRLIVLLTFFIFLINGLIKHNFIEALLFAIAVAIGLAPEMLPMLITVNLSKGAMRMAKKKVIVKQLESIQNFGAMDILCTDKTGTLTMDNIALIKHCNAEGKEDEEVLRYAHINSYFQTGLRNILDRAILKHDKFIRSDLRKIDEIPYDFERKIMSVIVRDGGRPILVAKGAPEEILKRCKKYEIGHERFSLEKSHHNKVMKKYDDLSAEGFRVLAIAYKVVYKEENFNKEDECDLVFKGFAAFLDPPKPSVIETIKDMKKLGISLKILSGDNELVTRKVCSEVGIAIDGLLRGDEIEKMSERELREKAITANIFVRLSPLQKEKIVKALQAKKHIVGFMGDGINDAPALKAADIGISVNNASDIAKETAPIILLEKDLSVLKDCIIEGRKTFANVIKYIKMGASSNLGNMFSMTGASIFLPFLPMMPTQVLLNNFLYDVSQIAIPSDEVDRDYLATPRPWDIKFIKNFMLIIGPISSIFDFATFGVMWFIFHASPELFRTGWFVESLATQTLVVFIIRTSKIPFFESKPSKSLLASVCIIVLIGMLMPYSFLGKLFAFSPLPVFFFIILLLLVFLYLCLVQIAKNIFIKKYGYE